MAKIEILARVYLIDLELWGRDEFYVGIQTNDEPESFAEFMNIQSQQDY